MIGEFKPPPPKQAIGRFRLLLLTIVLMIGLRPFLDGLIATRIIADILFSCILIAGVYALSKEKWPLYMALSLVGVYFPLNIAHYFFIESKWLDFFLNGLSAAFSLQMLVMIVSHIRREREITPDLILGAACGYLLLGLLWAFAYNFIDLIHPHSFRGIDPTEEGRWSYIYYSFVTLTTLGYGDISPATDQAKALSILEAILGQLYVAITIARLVGLDIAQAHGK